MNNLERKAKQAAYHKQWRQNNKEHLYQYQKEYKENNRDKVNKARIDYYERNIEKLRKYHSEWAKEKYWKNKEINNGKI